MKKCFLILALVVLILIVRTKNASAAILFSDDLKTSYSGYTQFFGSCPPTSEGFNCNSALRYDTPLLGMKCVSADFNNPRQQDSFIAMSDDMTGIDSSVTWLNRHIVFRLDYNGHPDIDSYLAWPPTAISTITTPSGNHTYTLCKDDDTFRGYIDGQEAISYTEVGHNPVIFAIGGASGTQVTNLTVTDSLPTTPTPTPTPTPAQTQLSVTSLKQNDPAWKNFTYDKANIWAPSNPTLGNWGCAVTSAAMVLNYYNIHKLPGQGNTDLTPETLDAWLNIQPDGYIGNGLVNWLAIARLTHLAKSNNPTFPFDALEYTRVAGQNDTRLLADINAGHPDILEEPGHFVVATAQSGTTFAINDPYYSRDTLASYGNTYSSIGTYLPSFTDLSYILITGLPDTTFTLKDNNGNLVGDIYIQQPITGAESNTSSGGPVKVLELQKPSSGTYTLTVSGSTPQITTINGYLYDANGDPSPFTKTLATDPQNQSTYQISFNPGNTSSDTITKVVTYNSLLKDLSDLYNTKSIRKGTFKSFASLVKNAQKQQQKHNTFIEKIDLMIIEGLLKSQKRFINNNAYQILLEDIQYLQNHL